MNRGQRQMCAPCAVPESCRGAVGVDAEKLKVPPDLLGLNED